MSQANIAPATLGKYQIRGVLGRGAMGTVYDGWDPVIGRRVAIKTVRLMDQDDPEMQEGLARFKNEAQAAGRLSHPNIVAVYDYGEADDTAFIVMEFIEGQSLKERLDTKEPLPLAEVVRVMEQVLAGLQFSHDKGVIHRDIKPGNVMLTKDAQVKLADFGIARIDSSVMTQAGTVLGTPAYMSPEQLMAQTVDARSDIYSSGVLLYQLLTGERPYEGGLTAIIHKALNTTPPTPSEISVTAPPGLDPVVARAMAKRPADRYPDAASFARALRQAFQAPATPLVAPDPAFDEAATMIVAPARSVSIPPPARPVAVAPPPSNPPAPRRGLSPALIGGAAVVVLGLAGTGGWLALQPRTPAPDTMTGSTTAPSPAPEPQAAVTPPAPPVSPVTPTPAAAPPAEDQTKTAATPPEPPAPEPPLDLAAARTALASLAATAHCALPRFDLSSDGRLNVSGLISAGQPDAMLRTAVHAAFPSLTMAWGMRGVIGPYCDVFDTIRPVALDGSSPLSLALKGSPVEATHLKQHDLVLPVITMPDFPAYLLVDYIVHDGSVQHLYPTGGTASAAYQAGATVRLGTSSKDKWEVGPPYGTDMIVATASSVPLLPRGRVGDDETLQTYLPALRSAIAAAQGQGGKVTSRALVVETVEK